MGIHIDRFRDQTLRTGRENRKLQTRKVKAVRSKIAIDPDRIGPNNRHLEVIFQRRNVSINLKIRHQIKRKEMMRNENQFLSNLYEEKRFHRRVHFCWMANRSKLSKMRITNKRMKLSKVS